MQSHSRPSFLCSIALLWHSSLLQATADSIGNLERSSNGSPPSVAVLAVWWSHQSHGTSEVGVREVGACDVGTGEVGATEVGATEVGSSALVKPC